MLRYGVAFVATAIPLLAMDAAWLNYASSRIYRPRLGSLLVETPNLAVAAGFYLLYSLAVAVLVVVPAAAQGSWFAALACGALLGAAAYGTYDITNLATLRGWPLSISLIDMTWGIVVTALAATAGYFVTRALAGPA